VNCAVAALGHTAKSKATAASNLPPLPALVGPIPIEELF
jgi:hypothetical protein